MSLFADRVQETSITSGTGTLTLGGAVSGYRTFASAFTDGDTVRYAIALGTAWEVGEGVYSAGTLTRTTVFASSNSNALVSFSSSAKNVWCDVPAATLAGLGAASAKASLYKDANGNVAGSSVLSVEEASQFVAIVATNQSTLLQLTHFASSSLGANFMVRHARGTAASPTKVLSGDALGGFFARGYYEDGTPGYGPSTANAVKVIAAEDWSSTTQGSTFRVDLSKIGAATAVEVATISGHGYFKLTPQAAAAGSIPTFTFVAAAHTGQTTGELNEVLWNFNNTITFATGNVSIMRTCRITPRTYAFAGASIVTTAATLAIGGAPIAGANATLQAAYSLWCQAGLAKFDGGVSTTTLACTGASPWCGRGTFASRPSVGVVGRLYMCTDGPLSFYDDGTAWQPFLARANLTSTPAVSTLTQINAGGRATTLSDSKGGILMQMTNANASDDYRVAKIAKPATSAYSFTVHMMPMLTQTASCAAGICFRNSSTGNLTLLGVVTGTAGSYWYMIRNETASVSTAAPTFTFSSDIVTAAAAGELLVGDGIWLRITDDGVTNKTFHYSVDGVNFVQLASVARTSFFTPDEIGIWVANIATPTTSNATAFFTSWLAA